MAPTDRKALRSELQSMMISTSAVLSVSGQQLSDVYFPTGAVISARCASNNMTIEVRGVGSEGMLGAEILRATEDERFELACQIGGSMLYMPVARFRFFLGKRAGLQDIVARYSLSVLMMLTQSVVCNGLHTIPERCARWLLTTSDRVDCLEFPLTHQLLAQMLGVRRSGVSIAVARLQRLEIIRYRHGNISILDARRLEAESCDCYRAIAHQTHRARRERM